MTSALDFDRAAASPVRDLTPWGRRLETIRGIAWLGATWLGVRVRRYPSRTVGLGAFVVYTAASLVRFARMNAGIDLAIFTQAVQQYSQGHLPRSYLKAAWGFNLLGDHFTPVVGLLAPFYRLWPDARVLLVAQGALAGLAAAIVTRSAVRALGPRTGAGIGLGFALAWGIQSMVLFDFHEVAFALPLLALSLAELAGGREVRAIAWALPLMVVKEDSVFLLLGIALFLLVRRRWWPAAGLAAFAVGTFALIVGVLMPAIGYYGTYTYWSSSAANGGALTSLWASVTSGKALILVLALLAPSLGLAVRSPIALIALPSLASRLTSANETHWGVYFHYNATVTVILVFAVIDALQQVQARRHWNPRMVARGAWVVVAVSVIATWGLPLGTTARSVVQPCPACIGIPTALKAIPDHASVAADDTLAAYLVDRDYVHELGPGLLDSAGNPLFPEYIAVDRSRDGIWATPISVGEWREALVRPAADFGGTYQFMCEHVLATPDGTIVYDVLILRTAYPSSPR